MIELQKYNKKQFIPCLLKVKTVELLNQFGLSYCLILLNKLMAFNLFLSRINKTTMQVNQLTNETTLLTSTENDPGGKNLLNLLKLCTSRSKNLKRCPRLT